MDDAVGRGGAGTQTVGVVEGAAVDLGAGALDRGRGAVGAGQAKCCSAGSPTLQEHLVSTVADAPDSTAPIDAAAAGLEAAGSQLPDRKTARRRQAIIAANAELHERELIKLASWSAAIADVLRRRGVEDPTATLTAEVAIAVFRTAFDRWIDEAEDRDFAEVFRESLGQLKTLTAVG